MFTLDREMETLDKLLAEAYQDRLREQEGPVGTPRAKTDSGSITIKPSDQLPPLVAEKKVLVTDD